MVHRVQPRQPSCWYIVGLTHAALIGICAHGLHTGFLLSDQDGIKHLRGAYGEENTRDELKTAKRRRLIWCWVDSIGLERGDLDHFVVSRRGGVLVLDSKWRNQVTAGDTQAMAEAARRVKLRAEAVARSLLKGERSRHPARVDSVGVRPVVVLWGAAQHRVPGGVTQVDGIDFVAGRHLRRWLRQLEGDLVSRAAAAQLEERLLEFREVVRRSKATSAELRRQEQLETLIGGETAQNALGRADRGRQCACDEPSARPAQNNVRIWKAPRPVGLSRGPAPCSIQQCACHACQVVRRLLSQTLIRFDAQGG